MITSIKSMLICVCQCVWAVLKAPTWKTLSWILGLGLFASIAFLIKLTCGAGGGGDTRPLPDPSPDVVVPVFDKRLDAFRADWNIRGRFEAWPALLPLAEMSNTAYRLEPDAAKDFKERGFTSTRIIDSPFHSQVAYVASGEDVLVIAFRGTDDTEDWFSNANQYLRKMPDGEIHAGFSGAYGMLRTQILSEVGKANPKHIWVTGHSLGGAMALICAFDLVRFQDRTINGVITFGQPRIGKEPLMISLREKLGDRYVHFANGLDAVPQVPMGFSHCGCLLHFIDGKVRKSEEYFEKQWYGATPPTDNGPIEYEPIKALPSISKQKFDEFQRSYDGEKPPRFAPVTSKQNPTIEDMPPVRGGWLPWKDDHSMDRYVEKIKDAIERAKSK